MKQVIKNIIFLILGIIIGSIVNMGLIVTGGYIFPFPDNANLMDATNWKIIYFLFPFLAHSIGTLVGAFSASKLSKNYHIIIPLTVGIYFLAGGIFMITILPAPLWFICLDLIISYIPMSLLGWALSNK